MPTTGKHYLLFHKQQKVGGKDDERACTFWIMLLCNSYKELPEPNSNFLAKMTLEMT